MIIYKKEKFIEVTPSDGYILTDGQDYFEGLCCPLGVNVSEIYTEITIEEYEELLINKQSDETMEDDNDGRNDNWTNN